jgi:hypothetical protein
MGLRFAKIVERPAEATAHYGARMWEAGDVARQAQDVHVYVHTDPGFPGRVAVEQSPRVHRRRVGG